MKKIGIISDTHGCFDKVLKDFLAGVDEIWHAGDFGSIETADEIAAFKPLVGVRGNIDGGAVRISYPEYRMWDCEGVGVLMIHIGGSPGRYDPKALGLIEEYRPRLFVTGHSHILKVLFDKPYNLFFINPGAAGCFGSHTVRTAVRLIVDGTQIRDMEVDEWPRSNLSKI